jgi:hypothetical protein
VSDLWVVGDLRTLLFAGGQGLANSTFSHVGGLPDLFMEHDAGALQGQENQNLSKNCCLYSISWPTRSRSQKRWSKQRREMGFVAKL